MNDVSDISVRKVRTLYWTGQVVLYIIVALFTIVMAGPFLWMVSTAFKPGPETIAYPPTWIPNQPTLQNFPEALSYAPFARFFLNSIIQGTSVTLSVLFFSSLTGYAFAKFNFKGRDILFILILSTMMIPFQVTMIPLYFMMKYLNLIDNLAALIIPGLISAFGIFLMRQFIQTIPTDLIDAARIDGCPEFGIYWRIILPLCKPPLATLSIFTFMANWDSFMWPLVVIDTLSKRTVPLGLALYSNQFGITKTNLLMAATLVCSLPVIILFVSMQKYFIKGITLTGLKG